MDHGKGEKRGEYQGQDDGMKKKQIDQGMRYTFKLSISLSISLISLTSSSFQKVMSFTLSPVHTSHVGKKSLVNRRLWVRASQSVNRTVRTEKNPEALIDSATL